MKLTHLKTSLFQTFDDDGDDDNDDNDDDDDDDDDLILQPAFTALQR